MRGRSMLAGALAACLSAAAAIQKADLNGLEIGIDEATGSLVSLSFPATGRILAAEPESSGLLDLAYPVEAFNPMRLASRFSKVQIRREEKGLTITWDRLGPSRSNFALPGGKVSAEVTVRAAEDGRSVVLSCRIANHSDAAVPQILFPDLWGLLPFDGVEHTQLRLARGVVRPFVEPIRPPGSAPFYVDRGWKHYPAGGYYALNALRWLDYGSWSGGLSIFQRKWASEDRPALRTWRSEKDPMRLRLVWEHRVAIEPGQSWESGEFWLTPHRGGWAKGIEVFREYVRRVSPPRELPRSVRDGLGFQTIWMMQSLERDPAKAAFRFTDLPRVARDALAHGIDQVVPWGWCTYFSLPIPIREELGTRQELLESIRKAKELGVTVAPFVSIQTLLNHYAQKYGVKPGTGDWTYDPELIPNLRPYYSKVFDGAWVEADNPAWQKDVLSEMSQWVEAGMRSFTWDQFSAKSIHGAKPDAVRLFEQLRSLARARDRESSVGGESITAGSLEHDGAVLDFTWNWVDYVDAGPILNVLRAPRLNCNIEDSPLVAKKAFAEGLYLNVIVKKPDQPNGTALISEQPALAAALKELAALRKQFLRYFVDGVSLGDSFLSQEPSAFVRGHQLPGKLLVIVVNDRPGPHNVIVRSDLDLWLPSAPYYEVTYFDSRGRPKNTAKVEGNRWAGVTPMLEPLEIALFEIQTG